MVRVKICGLGEPEEAAAAASLGSDLLGVVFAPSRRQVSLERAEEIAKVLAKQTQRPQLVGVFVNQPVNEVNAAALVCDLDYVQLHGDETPKYCEKVCRPVIKALWWAPWEGEDEIAQRIDSYLEVCEDAKFLLDTHAPGVYGGSGRTWAWERASRLVRWGCPILIAGGLTPRNVGKVVQTTRPWGVDVSSGVETKGRKDLAKIKAFIDAVRRADRQDPALTAEAHRPVSGGHRSW